MKKYEEVILKLIYNEHKREGGLVDKDILERKFCSMDRKFNGELFDMGMDKLKQYGYIKFTMIQNDYINIEITPSGIKYMQNQNR
ncbi:MAG: hypothetical protein SOX50_02115 [Terrisporobacter othiniensis]|uniref:hypothetical protein n=1 Tax=Terrisporobacter othiniensis TaxID=1577792 RepID=UPI002A76513F|nr:hypothetical protein [Terrisporobacter othiniensis]MDY3372071.1 hypothetical protein [Terrisporobacter othiniensis]